MGQGDGAEPNGAATIDNHRLADCVSSQDRVNGVPKGLLDGGHSGMDRGVGLTGVSSRERDVLREASLDIYADYGDVLTDMLLACAALIAFTTGNVGLGGYEVTYSKAGHIVTLGHNGAGKLVTKDKGRFDPGLCPGIPVIDVSVGTAD